MYTCTTCIFLNFILYISRLPTEHEGRSGEYWPEVVAALGILPLANSGCKGMLSLAAVTSGCVFAFHAMFFGISSGLSESFEEDR